MPATSSRRDLTCRQANSRALPLRSELALAAVGEVLAMRVVFVVSSFTRSAGTENTRLATCSSLVLTPWPISTAPVLTPMLPSW